ncbi:MAG TPA: tetratricopeptide repeat protein [Acetobacteraceae bacterium]|nr:tetratricopeptide repeat protein [Acetobacteraceae bacterium]
MHRSTRLARAQALLAFAALALAACAATSPIVARQPGLAVADAALAGGDPAMALRVARGVLRMHPHSASALVHEGDALYALGRLADARNAYRAALAVAPGSVAARIGSGRCDLASDATAAAARFAAVLRMRPHDAVVLNDFGIARDLQGRHAAAQAAYRAALAARPDMAAAEVNLGLSLALSGDSRKAIALLRPLAADPSALPRVRADFAAALVLAGHPHAAARILRTQMPPRTVPAAVAGLQALRTASR